MSSFSKPVHYFFQLAKPSRELLIFPVRVSKLLANPGESDSPRRVWRRLAQTLFAKGRPSDLLFILSERTTRLGERDLAQARSRGGSCFLFRALA
ncbi:hypothetical protein DEO72_LG3g1454 [Vigna unguiculata]|uniref:Uncharacterized protein n=1 Tax=Vigna unguiculata TaxID=3917 RepID=A0A4D6LF10_VIGUN|nr:hypothetical protein DEO72_LG3g1454 [Vigna unguiculata]